MRLGRRLAGQGSSSPLDEPDQRVVFINCSGGTLRSSRERRIEHVGMITDRRAAAQRRAGDHGSIKALHRTVADPRRESPQTYYSVWWIHSIEEEADSQGWESLADRPSIGSVIVRDARGRRSVELGVCRHEGIAVWFFFR